VGAAPRFLISTLEEHVHRFAFLRDDGANLGCGPAGETVFTPLLDMMEQVEADQGQTTSSRYSPSVLADCWRS
jgi:hypothetical protein